jgi:hypothetical protein
MHIFNYLINFAFIYFKEDVNSYFTPKIVIMAARKGKVKEEQAVVTLGPQVQEGFLF